MISELTEAEDLAYEEKVAVAKNQDDVKAEAAVVKARYVKNESLKLVVKDGITYPEAERIILSRTNGRLLSEDVIHFQDGTICTVGEIAENPEQYDGKSCADPVEPEEGLGRAKFFANTTDQKPLIHSKLHHGITYYLQIKDVLIIKQLKEMGEALSVDVWGKVLVAAKLSQDETNRVFDYLRKGGATYPSRITSDFKKYLKKCKANDEVKIAWEQLENTAGDKLIIEHVPQDINGVVQETENALINVPGKWPYISYGGALGMVCTDTPGGKARGVEGVKAPNRPAIKFYNDKSLLLRVEHSALFYVEKEDTDGVKSPVHVKVSPTIIKHLLGHPAPMAPKVTGLLSHPIVGFNGNKICKEGLDKATGLWFDFGGFNFESDVNGLPVDAKGLVDYVMESLFAEFIFSDEQSKALALAMLLTGLQRKILDTAPGFLVVANVQGSGKTSLCRLIHSIITGHDMAVNSLDASSTEVHKELISILKQSPEMVCFDNVEDGTELNEARLSKLITSEYYSGRLLGGNQEVRLPTNSLFSFTGNNVTLSSDLVRRMFCIRLTADRERPEERVFKHNDIVQRSLDVRSDVICACLQIIEGYIKAGSVEDFKGHRSSGFPQWDKMVRFPILWATGVDILDSMTKNREDSTEHRSMAGIVEGLHEIYGDSAFTSTDLLKLVKGGPTSADQCIDKLRECIANLSLKALENTRSLTAQLKKLDGRLFEQLMLEYKKGQNRKGGFYTVQRISG